MEESIHLKLNLMFYANHSKKKEVEEIIVFLFSDHTDVTIV
jgi:hypothetical protein